MQKLSKRYKKFNFSRSFKVRRLVFSLKLNYTAFDRKFFDMKIMQHFMLLLNFAPYYGQFGFV